MKSVSEEIAALRAMPVPALVARYEELHGKPPRVKNRQWLFKKCAWRIQEQRYGGLSKRALARIDVLIAEMVDLPLGRTARQRTPEVPPIRSELAREPGFGTTLVREWKGREVRATRVEGGWECDGVVHRSLTAVVQAVTGSHASGRAWFGLTRRTRR
jgi:hypothetical protein